MIHFERVPHASAGFRRVPVGSIAETLLRRQALASKVSAWEGAGLRVISTVEHADYPDGKGDAGPQWHLSITAKRGRPTDRQVKAALKAFAVPRAEEDNHHPGLARHFWCPIDPTRRVDCECKTDEAVVVEGDGYRWSNDLDPTKCRGCEFERLLGNPCSVHGGAQLPAR